MKKFIFAFLLMGILLAGCGAKETIPEETTESAAEEQLPERRFTVATSGSWKNVSRGILFEKYAEKLKDWSDGRIIIQLYDDSTLGDDLQLIEGVKLGTLNIINCVPSYLTPAVPEAGLLDIPTMFGSVEEFNALMDGGYFSVMQQYFEENDLKLISCRAYDMRQMTSNVYVSRPEDIQGLRLRTMEVDSQIAFWQSLGAMTIPLPFSQVKLALQLGSIDAQENPLYYLESIQLNEVQDYVILTNHLPMVSCYVMNLEQWNELEEEEKSLLERFISEMNEELIRETDKQNQSIIASADSLGIRVIEAGDALSGYLDTGMDAVLEMLTEKLGEEKVSLYIEAAEKAKAAAAAGN